ncbi:MAG: hypothetical protein WCH65_07470 [bacterium]
MNTMEAMKKIFEIKKISQNEKIAQNRFLNPCWKINPASSDRAPVPSPIID